MRDLQEFLAGAMGSLLSPASPLPPSSSPPSPRSPSSPSAMLLCGPGQMGLLEIPWCRRAAPRAPCLPTNARGPFLVQCRPQRTNTCNDTEMRTLPLNPSTHSPSATKPPHHSPKHPPTYESRHAAGYQSLHPPVHHQPKPASHPTQPKHPHNDCAFGKRGFLDNANWTSRKQLHMSGAMAETCWYEDASETVQPRLPCQNKSNHGPIVMICLHLPSPLEHHGSLGTEVWFRGHRGQNRNIGLLMETVFDSN